MWLELSVLSGRLLPKRACWVLTVLLGRHCLCHALQGSSVSIQLPNRLAGVLAPLEHTRQWHAQQLQTVYANCAHRIRFVWEGLQLRFALRAHTTWEQEKVAVPRVAEGLFQEDLLLLEVMFHLMFWGSLFTRLRRSELRRLSLTRTP